MKPGARVNIETGRPEVVQADQARVAAHQSLANAGHALEQELTSGEGQQHLTDMLDDYQRLSEQLVAGASIFKAEIPTDVLLAKMDYIQTRVKAWGLTVAFGRRARATLERDAGLGILRGGPA